MKRHFSRKDIQIAKKLKSKDIIDHESSSRKSKSKPMKYYIMPFKMTIIKKTRSQKCWYRYGEKGTHFHCWWNWKLAQPL